jgi:glucosamine-6-phosphate deaminase
MKVLICKDTASAVQSVADLVAAQVSSRPGSVVGLATGSTMESVYEALVQRHRAGLSFSQVHSFNLDEYVGLSPEHLGSYHHYMREHLFRHIDIAIANTHIPSGTAPDWDAEAARYEQSIAERGGIDLQLLGLGRNGHIGFNEPGSSLVSRTRIKRLTRDTITANQGFFGPQETPPRYALTMGIGTIMAARSLVLLATGVSKAQAVAHVVEGAVCARWPGSMLQLHPKVCVVLDPDAASHLELRDYYLDIHPPWGGPCRPLKAPQ